MNWQQILLSFDKSFYYLFPATAVAMTTAFYVIKTHQSVFERRMRTYSSAPPESPRGTQTKAPLVEMFNRKCTDIRPNHFKSALGGATYVYARLRFVSP